MLAKKKVFLNLTSWNDAYNNTDTFLVLVVAARSSSTVISILHLQLSLSICNCINKDVTDNNINSNKVWWKCKKNTLRQILPNTHAPGPLGWPFLHLLKSVPNYFQKYSIQEQNSHPSSQHCEKISRSCRRALSTAGSREAEAPSRTRQEPHGCRRVDTRRHTMKLRPLLHPYNKYCTIRQHTRPRIASTVKTYRPHEMKTAFGFISEN